MLPLIDSHCHLASARFTTDLDQIIARARTANISQIITLATDFDDFTTNIQIAETYPEVFAAIGIHPTSVTTAPADWADKVHHLATHAKVKAIGETGLDYYHPAPVDIAEATYHQLQGDSLRTHFAIAAEHHLPIILHTRDRSGDASLADALALATEYAGRVRAMFHCYPGDMATAEKIIAIDGIISIGGIVTFRSAKKTHELAQKIPLDKFTLETDAPYLAPTPHRGERNEPALVQHTAAAIAALRDTDIATIATATTKTARDFFDIRS